MSETGQELKKKAVDFTLEWAKQITTISSAILVLSATFIKDIASAPIKNSIYIQISWAVLIISIVLGVIVISGLIAQLNEGKITKVDVYSSGIRIPALLQILCLLTGITLLVMFTWSNF